MNELTVQQVAIEELKPAEYNPRKWSEEARRGLTASLNQFGFVQPIVANSAPHRRGVIIGGNFKLDIAKQRGDKTVPVVWVNIPDLKKEKELNLRLNKNQGEFDDDLLSEFDEDLLEDVGWESKELDKIFNESDEDDFDGDKEVEKIITPISKIGDVYELGQHKVMCGDSSKEEDVAKLMGGVQADMVFTDPPYGLDYSGGRTQVVEQKAYGKIKGDKLSGVALGNLLSQIFNFTKQDADLYVCVSPIIQKPFLDFIDSKGKDIDAVIVWDKKAPGLGYMAYRRQTEFILFIKGGEFKKGDKSDFDLWSISKHNTSDYSHGTQKPVGLPTRAIRNSSKRGDIILDLFGGSGSTLIAADQTSRTCYLMEIDGRYCDVIIKRWEKLTGEKAVKL